MYIAVSILYMFFFSLFSCVLTTIRIQIAFESKEFDATDRKKKRQKTKQFSMDFIYI